MNPFSFLKKTALWVSLLTPTLGVGQSKSLSQQLVQYNQQAVQEKVFVHLDRPLYLVGETMWFKTFCLDASLHTPLDMSKVAYLEVLDRDHNPVLQTKIALDGGKGFGSVFIPPFVASGQYSVRSYTHWMKNFSPDFYFESTVSIVNPFSKPSLSSAPKPTLAYDLQLFPEGGNLVQGLESNVAFRAVGQDGKGIKFRGSIVNQQNDTVAHFEPLKFGIGTFSFTPKEGDAYRVLLQDAKRQWFTYTLPTIKTQGYVMQVKESTLALEVTVSAPTQTSTSEVYLLAHTKSVPKATEKKALTSGKATFALPKSALGDGITSITIFDENQKPVCERLYFKRPTQPLLLSAQPDKKQYNTREKINLELTSSLKSNTPTVADLSVSVFLIDSLPTEDPPLIDTYLALTSDLKGTVESPSYYFINSGQEVDQALDNLMLTHGWRRFNWEDIDKKVIYNHLPEQGGHFVSGKVVHTQTGLPAPYVATYLSAPSKRPQLFVSRSDTAGRISYEVKHFFGTKEIIVQTNTQYDSTYRIEINSPFSDKISSYSLPPFAFDAGWKNDLLTRSINMQAQNAFLPKSALQTTTGETDTLAFYGIPDEKYFLDAFTRFPTVEEVLREYVPGVGVRKRRGKFYFLVFDKLQPSVFFEEDPLMLVDGVPVFDTDKIMAFDPLKIKKLEVITGIYYLGPMAFSGIVSFSTYKGDLAGFPLDPRALVQSYEGVQAKKTFYAPVYDTPEQQKSRTPDLRNLLFWAPQVITDAQGRQSLSFYSSDQSGTYKAVIQGMTENGFVGSKTFTFEVKKSTL
ncbi:hypothetical protein [Runella rosea]|uniref:hypothetical protein n=1 Tax=Runella rosea TaxID=2259595 RepID=UPI0019653F7A|nr:hypothetical protein [Runella rosea]